MDPTGKEAYSPARSLIYLMKTISAWMISPAIPGLFLPKTLNSKTAPKIEIGENIKLIGELLEAGRFRAMEIRPWGKTCIMETCKINH